MGRTKGVLNKQVSIPEVYALGVEDRLQMIAALLVDIISEELCTRD